MPDSKFSSWSSASASRPLLAQEVEERSRIDRAGARRHRYALERAEAHRRVDGASVAHRRHRAAAAEVADDELRHAHPLGAPLHGQAVESVAAHAPVAPPLRHGVRRRLVGDRRVERRVEDRDVRDVRQARAAPPRSRAMPARCAAARAPRASRSRPERRRRSRPARGTARRRARRGARPPRTCPGTWPQDVTSPGLVPVDDVQLQARRAGVDYEKGQTQSRTSG